jgi:hypothetical protein
VLKRIFNLENDKAFADIKEALLQKGAKIVSEDPSKHLVVKQGSLWGMSPSTAKKTVELTFVPVNSGTQVGISSRLSSGWKNLTIIGCALACVLVALCLWMALDLTTFMSTGRASFWSWLASVNGNVDVSVAQTFVNLTKALAVFLSLIIVLEIAVAIYVYKGIDRFAQETFDVLSKNEKIATRTNSKNAPKLQQFFYRNSRNTPQRICCLSRSKRKICSSLSLPPPPSGCLFGEK